MVSRTAAARRRRRWVRYQRRMDSLVTVTRRDGTHAVRTNPGYFRAEGWNTDGPRWNCLRHGA